MIELRCGFKESKDGFINPCQDVIDDKLPEAGTRFEDRQDNDYVPMRFYPTEPYDANAGLCNIMLRMDGAGGKKMSQLVASLPKTWSTPTMAPECPDDKKYAVVDAITRQFEDMRKKGENILGRAILDIVTVNGVRVTLADGTWGLVRASSNKPSLVVVVESPTSESDMRAMFADIDARLSKFPEVGEYDQKI